MRDSGHKKERGMVTLATVCILLVIVGLTVVSTALSINHFYHIEKATRDSHIKKLALRQALRAIAEQLRSDPTSQVVLDNTDITHTITSLDLHGENNQKLQHVTINVSKTNNDIVYSAEFLRYPSLLRLPQQTQHNTHDSNITKWLFNRTSDDLQLRFFPEQKQFASCDSLSSTTVQWITGDCVIESTINTVSSDTTPQLLIVENGNITIKSGARFYGLILQLTRSSHTYAFHLETNALLVGALTSNKPTNRFLSGSLSYSISTLTTLQDNKALSKMILIPGTWREF